MEKIMNKATLSAEQLATLSQVPASEIEYWHQRGQHNAAWPVDIESFSSKRYSYRDALAIEIARQMNDDSGICGGPSVLEGLRIVSYTGAVPLYFDYTVSQPHVAKALTDCWLAVFSSRHSCDEWGRGKSVPVTSFGASEYWSSMHVVGSFDQVTREIKQAMTDDTLRYPDTDPGRVFMANVSAADRRLRKRASDLGIHV
jgi:hypothetical protein